MNPFIKTSISTSARLIVPGNPVFVDWNVFGVEKFTAGTVFPWKNKKYSLNVSNMKYLLNYRAVGRRCCRRPWRSEQPRRDKNQQCWLCRDQTQSLGSLSSWPKTWKYRKLRLPNRSSLSFLPQWKRVGFPGMNNFRVRDTMLEGLIVQEVEQILKISKYRISNFLPNFSLSSLPW